MSLTIEDVVPQDRREEVLAAAAECFMRRGYEQTSMDDVAETLGATKGRVYHHSAPNPNCSSRSIAAPWRS